MRISAASKLGRYDAIASEIERYEREVVRLPPGVYAPIVAGKVSRVVGSRGVFYRLWTDTIIRFLTFYVIPMPDAASCIKALQLGQAPWFENRAVKKARVGDLAKLLVWEYRLPAIYALLNGIDWAAFEERKIAVNMCTRHGDLHGENARVDANHKVMLIDYGSVGDLPSAIDPVTLELSPFFHPHGHRDLLQWTAGKGEIDWFDRDAFRAQSRFPEYITAARSWSHAEAFGEREVLACSYIYLLRQLQFDTTDKALVLALLAGIVRRGLRLRRS